MDIYKHITELGPFALAQRQRVDSLLAEAVRNPLVILSAGSGHGKTQAVSSYISHQRERVIWIHLTELENYEQRFWGLLTKAISHLDRKLSDKMAHEGFPDSLPSFIHFLEDFSQSVYNGERLILVFDDFDSINEGAVKGFVRNLIRSNIENMCVVLLAGTKVDIGLEGSVRSAFLTDKQLRFTREEIRVYYTALGIVLSEGILDKIIAITEGWALAVYLLGLRLYRGELLSDESVDQATGFILDILEQEFILPLTQQRRKALVLLSLLDRFSLKMAKAVTGLSSEDLTALVNGNPFIQFHMEDATYSFHTILQQLLEQRRVALNKKSRDAFFLRVAQWYRESNQNLEAITFYYQVGALDEIYNILLSLGLVQLKRDTALRGMRMLDSFPSSFYDSHPMMWNLRCNMLFCAGFEEQSTNELQNLCRELSGSSDLDGEHRAVLGECHIQLGYLSMRRATYDFVGHYKAAAELLPDGSCLVKRQGFQVLGTGSAMIYAGPEPGSLKKMLSALFQSMPYSRKVLNGAGYGRQHMAAAEVCYYTGDLAQAEKYSYEAMALSREREQWDIVCNAYYILMRIAMANGNLDGVEENSDAMHRTARQCNGTFSLPEIADSGFWIKVGRHSMVSKWIMDDDLYANEIYSARELVIKAGYLLAVKKDYEALAFIDSGIRHCTLNGQRFSALKLQILKAIAYDILDEYGIAAKNLQATYEAAHGNGIIMPFVEYGSHTCRLIEHVRALKNHKLPAQWLDAIYAKSSTYAKNVTVLTRAYALRHGVFRSTLDDLTAREREILKLVSKGLSNEEIADLMGILPATVKSTLKRVYSKIKAVNRADAARIAMVEETSEVTSRENLH